MQMIINDLSAKFPVDTISEGRQIMDSFLNTYSKVKKIIINDSVLMDQNYCSFELAKNYRIEQWRNDPVVDMEAKRRFRVLLNKSVIYDPSEVELESEFDLEIQGKKYISKGCLLAYETEGVTISFLSDDYWETPEISGYYVTFNEKDELKEEHVQVPNVSCQKNVEPFEEKYKEKRKEWRAEIRSAQDVLKCKETRFPNLIFCENAINGCYKNVGVAEAGQVYKRLLELQVAAEKMGNQFDKRLLPKASPETPLTLEQYETEHTFLLPEGNAQLFSWHTRFTGGYAGRIFFYPDTTQKKMYIGHIGHKLPTKKYPH